MRGGPRSFPLGFSCPVVLWAPLPRLRPSRTGLSPSAAGLPRALPLACRAASMRAPTPGRHAPRFGLLPFRSPLLRESSLFSSPPATWMFRFAGCPPRGRGGMRPPRPAVAGVHPRRVAPFRCPWIPGYVPLPMGFRSLSRLSSAPSAKASAPCPSRPGPRAPPPWGGRSVAPSVAHGAGRQGLHACRATPTAAPEGPPRRGLGVLHPVPGTPSLL